MRYLTLLIPYIAWTLFSAPSQAATLADEVESLKKQNQSQQEQIDKIKAEMGKSAAVTSPIPNSVPNSVSNPMSDTRVSGYGEINYNKYTSDNSRTQMDLRRFVLFLGHRFSEDIDFVSEVEWEHAVTSSTDKGESEIEQAYLNFRLAPRISLKAGLFLMPFGFLNESHEPPTYYGVERNEVETRIIPSTWREGGLGLYGTLESGFEWNLGVVTGFDVAKFDDASAPLASIHQELQFAKAQDLALYLALNYRIPGWVFGGAVFSGKSAQGDADYKVDNTKPSFAGVNARVTLGEVHARWQRSGWDVEALASKGWIGNADQVDDSLQTFNTANPTANRSLVPSEFSGWLVQTAYKWSVPPRSALAPFARYEQYNTQAKMPGILVSDLKNRDRVTTVGLSFYPDPDVVVKVDYQNYEVNSGNRRFDLGIGYMF